MNTPEDDLLQGLQNANRGRTADDLTADELLQYSQQLLVSMTNYAATFVQSVEAYGLTMTVTKIPNPDEEGAFLTKLGIELNDTFKETMKAKFEAEGREMPTDGGPLPGTPIQ